MADTLDSLFNPSGFFSVVPGPEELSGVVFAVVCAVEGLSMLPIYQIEAPVGNLNSERCRWQDIQFCGSLAE